MIKRILSFLLVMLSFAVSAQDNESPEMADAFRANGKIYVVITVISIVLVAVVALMIYIERRLKKLEEQVKDRNA